MLEKDWQLLAKKERAAKGRCADKKGSLPFLETSLYSAGEGVRTLDIHVGNVTLYH